MTSLATGPAWESGTGRAPSLTCYITTFHNQSVCPGNKDKLYGCMWGSGWISMDQHWADWEANTDDHSDVYFNPMNTKCRIRPEREVFTQNRATEAPAKARHQPRLPYFV